MTRKSRQSFANINLNSRNRRMEGMDAVLRFEHRDRPGGYLALRHGRSGGRAERTHASAGTRRADGVHDAGPSGEQRHSHGDLCRQGHRRRPNCADQDPFRVPSGSTATSIRRRIPALPAGPGELTPNRKPLDGHQFQRTQFPLTWRSMPPTAAGTNMTIGDYARRWAETDPDTHRLSRRSGCPTYASLLADGEALARALHDLGLRTGDVIGFQVPNWVEASIINLAANLGGFVINPIVPIYRDAEVIQMLGDCGAKA